MASLSSAVFFLASQSRSSLQCDGGTVCLTSVCNILKKGTTASPTNCNRPDSPIRTPTPQWTCSSLLWFCFSSLILISLQDSHSAATSGHQGIFYSHNKKMKRLRVHLCFSLLQCSLKGAPLTSAASVCEALFSSLLIISEAHCWVFESLGSSSGFWLWVKERPLIIIIILFLNPQNINANSPVLAVFQMCIKLTLFLVLCYWSLKGENPKAPTSNTLLIYIDGKQQEANFHH